MALAAFDILLEGVGQEESPTSLNPAVSKAVIGVDRLLDNASRALYGYLVDPEIDVRRCEAPGRYEVDLGFLPNIGMARRAQLAGIPRYMEPSPLEVLKALGWVEQAPAEEPDDSADLEERVHGLFPLLDALGGRPIDRLYLVGDQVDFECGDNVYHASYGAYRLLRHKAVREAVALIGEALRSPEIHGLKVFDRASGKLLMRQAPEQTGCLAMVPDEPAVLVDEVRTMALALKNPVFRTRKGWVFSDGAQELTASMADPEFVRLIDNGVFHLKGGDILVANVRIRTVQDDQGLHTTFEVLKVVDHRKPGRHLPMPGI